MIYYVDSMDENTSFIDADNAGPVEVYSMKMLEAMIIFAIEHKPEAIVDGNTGEVYFWPNKGIYLPRPSLDVDIPDTCTCQIIEWPYHACPYAEEIADDYETLCTCCPHCEGQCMADI